MGCPGEDNPQGSSWGRRSGIRTLRAAVRPRELVSGAGAEVAAAEVVGAQLRVQLVGAGEKQQFAERTHVTQSQGEPLADQV